MLSVIRSIKGVLWELESGANAALMRNMEKNARHTKSQGVSIER